MRLFKQFFLLLLFTTYIFTIQPASAQTMSNSDFKLKTNILLTPNKYLDNKPSVNNTKDNIFVGSNYKVVSGSKLIFSISQTLIDYGILSPTNPVSRTSLLSVYNNSLFGYSVFAFENHALYNETSNATIPDTTCDTGTCSKQNPALWSNLLTYGFGYRCDKLSSVKICSDDFDRLNYYKQFLNISNSQNPQALMSSTNLGEAKARITYKVNVSGSQPIGFYNNAITFVATADF